MNPCADSATCGVESMSASLNVCLFDPQMSSEGALRAAFEELSGLRIVGEFDNWEQLQECLCSGTADIVVVNLDAVEPKQSLQNVQRIAEVIPNCPIVGVSASEDPQAIIDAVRAGCSQFVRAPISADDLRDAIQRICVTRLPTDTKRIAVIGSSGGAGATTVASNLALELARVTETRCALVDMNLEFGDVACAFDIAVKYSIADVCREGVDVDRMILETALIELPCNVSILSRPERIEESRDVMPEAVEQMLRVLGQMFQYVVVDLPRSASNVNAAAVRNADHVLIVSELSVPQLRNATRVAHYLMELGVPEDQIELVLNRCNAEFERITPEEVEKHFKRPVFCKVPNDYRHVTAARDLGRPIVAAAPKSPARRAIQKMARKLSSAEEDAVQPQSSGGLFGRLLGRGSASKKG